MRLSFLVLLGLALVASLLGAQTLTLAQAEEIALKNHPALAEAQANSLRSDQVVREQQSAYYPALNGEITGTAG